MTIREFVEWINKEFDKLSEVERGYNVDMIDFDSDFDFPTSLDKFGFVVMKDNKLVDIGYKE